MRGAGLFYEGERLGSHFERDTRFLKTLKESEDVKHAAEVLRWFKAPVLRDEGLTNVVSFLSQHLNVVLPIWLSDCSPSTMELSPLNTDEEWRYTLSMLLTQIRHHEFTACLLYTSPSPRDRG